MPCLTVTALAPIAEIAPGDDLGAMLAEVAADDLAAGDILVIAHKVVSKSEGRLRRLDEVEPGGDAVRIGADQHRDPRQVQVVLDEAQAVLRAERGVIVTRTRHGFVCANSGVDLSNVEEGFALLLPVDPDASARRLRGGLAERLGVKPAVVISDSFGRAWRLGQTDIAIGAAGIVALDDWRGRADAHGRVLSATTIAVADALAGAADLARAKDGGTPAALVRGLARLVTDEDGPGAATLRRPPAEDLFL